MRQTMSYLLPLQQFSANVQQHPNQVYLNQPINRVLKSFTWKDVDTQARSVAASLKSMGLSAGDRVGIISANCAEWFITDLAIMMAGMISVPIYHTASHKTIRYILEESECKVIFVGKIVDLAPVNEAIDEQITRILFPYPTVNGQYQWQELLKTEPLEDISNPVADDVMTIVYTSGSTGNPKGVVLTFDNLASAAAETSRLNFKHGDHLMSYLPLAHITERSVVEISSLYASAKIYFVESIETFIDDVKVGQPDCFLSVPRLWVKFQSQILIKMDDKKLQRLLKIPIIKGIVAKKIRTGLGLAKCRAFVSGTAPISPSVLHWYNRIGMPISEGWGMSETSGGSCINLPFDTHAIGTIGKAISCVEMKLSDNNEILIKGAAVFKEYYKNPEATQKAFTDGWFHTGDRATLTAEDNYKITGRIKDQFKTAKGKYVVPVPIECLIAANTKIEQICVIGCGRKQPIALLVMNEQNNIKNTEIQQSLLNTLDTVNSMLESHQKLDHFVVLKNDWSIENELLTSTLKIKRNEIESAFEHFLTMALPELIYWEE